MEHLLSSIAQLLGIIVTIAAGPIGIWFRAAIKSWIEQAKMDIRHEYEADIENLKSTNEQDRNEVNRLSGVIDIMREKVEEKDSLIDYFKKQNELMIAQRADVEEEHNKQIARLIEVEKQLVEIQTIHQRLEADFAGSQVQQAVMEDKVITMTKALTETEREMYRYQGYRAAVKEILDKFGVEIKYTPPDPLNGDDKPDPSDGPGGGKKEEPIDFVEAIGKPIPEQKKKSA